MMVADEFDNVVKPPAEPQLVCHASECLTKELNIGHHVKTATIFMIRFLLFPIFLCHIMKKI